MKFHLVMIVKDEAPVIERCLASVRPVISKWTIVDTGSTDSTKQLIWNALKDINGSLYDRPWVNFEHNKSEAIRLAEQEPGPEYILHMDADDVLLVPSGWTVENLTKDAYNIEVRHGSIRHHRPHIFRAGHGFKFVGAVHEYLTSNKPHQIDFLDGIVYQCIGGGNRGTDSVLKFQRDAEMLEKALEKNPDEPRNTFYLAQSYKDLAGEMSARVPIRHHSCW